MRIYSIHRTSLDSVPEVKLVTDIQLEKPEPDSPVIEIVYTDTGLTGETVDPSELLYIGGENIVASTIGSKDNTLFLGGIQINGSQIINDNEIESINAQIQDCELITVDSSVPVSNDVQYYDYNISLDRDTAGFKSGELYRCGIQAQHQNGRWSEPFYYNDTVLNTVFPGSKDGYISRQEKSVKITKEIYQNLYNKGFRRLRTCIVPPTMSDRSIICQGVLNPTVYNVKSRSNNSPYAESSWFFRAACNSQWGSGKTDRYGGTDIRYNHGDLVKGEI